MPGHLIVTDEDATRVITLLRSFILIALDLNNPRSILKDDRATDASFDYDGFGANAHIPSRVAFVACAKGAFAHPSAAERSPGQTTWSVQGRSRRTLPAART
jgi:hypothetical protein